MAIVNAALRGFFDLLLYPFQGLHPLVGLTVMSLLTAIVMLLIFKATSNQEKLAAVKRQIHAGLFEIRLFNDDIRAILRAQWDILRHNFTYLRLSMVPLVVMIVPVALILIQLQFRYGYQGLKPGQPTLFKVELAEGWDAGADGYLEDLPRPQAKLTAPPGVRVEAGPVWIPAQGELAWRISAEKPGRYDLHVEVNGVSYTKRVDAAGGVVRRSPVRPAPRFMDELLYPAEEPLPAGAGVAAIHLGYPPGNVGVTGWDSEITWMIVFFVLSIVFAFALRKPFKVTI